MSRSHARVSRIRRTQSPSQAGALERLWSVAACPGCGATIVLGEQAGGPFSDVCAACQALPVAASVSAPVRIRVEGTPVRETFAARAPIGAGVLDAA